ncbi:MAG: hypothetical protein ACYDEJ_12660 [Desulfitobacteriaceae bacterium]
MNLYINQLIGLWKLIKKGGQIKDTLLLGSMGGLLGTIAMTLSNLILFRLRKTEILYGHIAGSLLMRPFKTNKGSNFILGQLMHFFTGSGVGLLMVTIFKKFGTDHSLFKGSAMGIFSWHALYTIGQRLDIYSARPHLTKTGYSALWNNLLYGLVTSQAILWLAHPSVFVRSKQDTEIKRNTINNSLSDVVGGLDYFKSDYLTDPPSNFSA